MNTRNLAKDQRGIAGIAFRSPLVTVGFLLLSIVSITLLVYNTGFLDESNGIVFNILLLSPLMICIGIVLILSNWTWDYRWLILLGAVSAVVYFIFILNPVFTMWVV